MILILLALVTIASQGNCCENCPTELLNRIPTAVDRIRTTINSVNEPEKVSFDVESNISDKSKAILQQMLNMANTTCTYHMEVNAFRYHLQKYLFGNAIKLSVKKIIILLTNLQMLSNTFQKLQLVRDKPKRPCVNFTAEQYKNIYKMLIPAPEQEKKNLLRMLLDRADEWGGYN